MVRTIKLNDGTSIPALGWGNMGGSAKAINAGAAAVKAGIVHIDSAQIYGTEREVIQAIEKAGHKRDDIYVTTKIFSFNKNPISADDIRASVQGSLDRLGFVPNLVLIHNPFIPTKAGMSLGEFWGHLEALVEDGTLKGCSIGLSNFRPVDIEEIVKVAKIKPVVNQIECHPYVLAHIQPVLDIQTKHGIVTQSYAALTPVHSHPTGGPLKPILTKLAEKLSKESGVEIDAAGVLILWTVCKGFVCVTSSGNEERIRNMAATEKVRDLTKEEIEEIDRVGQKVHFRQWDEHMTTDFPDPKLPSDA
ncbi:NADP-dependent oxidoreductase domain-containing protein [Kockovaella imperatae]|uniref:NADP-dependent oxidoreductase domain-containing protein n=1 Tax=Kockovaella imperatae TaxID=4999 RepID=A0A1Y1UHF1_9TREE|nr:NADP-dependent oxidoreductase domain-containing protein [Kockovaella imperatae]ORX36957.1 NADP-dependent oxidoreductase domain-containing protein [Kockovaella imperatae]